MFGADCLKEAANLLHSTFSMFVPNAVPMSKHPTGSAAADAVNPATYAVKSDKISVSIENALSRTIRLGCLGTREVYLTNAWTLSEFMSSTSIDKRMPPMKNVAMWMRLASETTVKAFLQHNDKTKDMMWHATLGPQDALMVPPGWIVAERTAMTSDCYGFRTSIFCPSDLPELERWDRLWVTQAAQNETLHAVIDFLTLLDSSA